MKKIDILFTGLLLILGVFLYANTFLNAFVYDDLVTVQQNLFIRDWRNLARFFPWNWKSVHHFLSNYYLYSGEHSFRPIVTWTYFWDYFWWQRNPWGYHLTNFVLHVLSGITVFVLSTKLSESRLTGMFAALIFLTHPALTEAVAAISFREDLLCAVFFYLAFFFYLKDKTSNPRPEKGKEAVSQCSFKGLNRHLYYMFSLIFWVLALLSKEMAVTFPLVVVAYVFLIGNERLRNTLRIKVLIYFFIAVVYIVLRFTIFYDWESLPARPEFGDLFTRCLLILKGIGLYGRLIFFPLDLTVEYPDPIASTAWGAYLLIPSLLTVAFVLFVWMCKSSSTLEKFGIAFLLITLLPVLNLVPSARLGAERFLYLPFFGFCLWGASMIVRGLNLFKVGKKRLMFAGGILIVFVCWGARTISGTLDWRNNLDLFSRAVEVSPQSSRAHFGLGNEYFRQGRISDAVKEHQKAIAIFPWDPFYYNSLGVAYGELGQLDRALVEFKTCARLNPSDPLVLVNLCAVYLRMGHIGIAEEKIQKYIGLRPYDPKGYINLGEICSIRGDYPSAIRAYEEALALDPYSAPGLTGLGYCRFKLRDYKEARRLWEKILRLDPDNWKIRHNLNALKQMSKNADDS